MRVPPYRRLTGDITGGRRARTAGTAPLVLLAWACGGATDPLSQGTYTLAGTPDAASEARNPGYESVVSGRVTFTPDGPARRDSVSGVEARALRGGGTLRLCTTAGRCAARRVTVGPLRADGTFLSYRTSAGEVRLVLDQDGGGPEPPVILGADLRPSGGTLQGAYSVLFITGARVPPSVAGTLRLTPAP